MLTNELIEILSKMPDFITVKSVYVDSPWEGDIMRVEERVGKDNELMVVIIHDGGI